MFDLDELLLNQGPTTANSRTILLRFGAGACASKIRGNDLMNEWLVVRDAERSFCYINGTALLHFKFHHGAP
jgi:hypothetical protein